MTTTTIVNATTHVLKIKEGNYVYSHLVDVPSMQAFIMHFDLHASYREYNLVALGNQDIILSSDDLIDAAEITVFETLTQKLEYRVSKIRGSTYEDVKGNIRDSTAFDAVTKDASSRMKIIDKSQASLVMLSNKVKICPAQCQNLVQTCLEGDKR